MEHMWWLASSAGKGTRMRNQRNQSISSTEPAPIVSNKSEKGPQSWDISKEKRLGGGSGLGHRMTSAPQ